MNQDAKRREPEAAREPHPDMGNMQKAAQKRPYDPELLYVECRLCGKPVIWAPGKTTEILSAANIDAESLDETCLIVSDGCFACCPHESAGFAMVVAKLAGEQAFVTNLRDWARPWGKA